MKRVGNIFDDLCSMENISMAHHRAKKGKRHYTEVKMVDRDPGRYLVVLQRMLIDGGFKTSAYVAMTKQCSGKQRDILKLPYYPDRIVHHCIVQVLSGLWFKTLIRDTFACIPGRGIHDGMRRITQALRDGPGTRYCLKMDVQKFYPSIDHGVLKLIIRRQIKDGRVLELIDEIIDSTPAGVPIGNYLSQHFGNLYLSGYDHWMKEVRGCRYYYRYCDDVVVLDGSKERLHQLRADTARYWTEHLRLTMKSDWQVFPVDARGIDFLGYRFFHGYTLLRKSIAKRVVSKTRHIKKHWRRMPPRSIIGSVVSYDGWMRHANCLNLRRAVIDPELRDIVRRASIAAGVKDPLQRSML